MATITLYESDLARLPPYFREQIWRLFVGATSEQVDMETFADDQVRRDRHGAAPMALSESQAHDFVLPCAPKTLQVIRFAAAADVAGFSLRAFEQNLRIPVDTLSGVWTGLTRRIRTVTGKDDAFLFCWDEDTDYDWGWMHPTTHANFRKVFRIKESTTASNDPQGSAGAHKA
jgi:hypothetical protein